MAEAKEKYSEKDVEDFIESLNLGNEEASKDNLPAEKADAADIMNFLDNLNKNDEASEPSQDMSKAAQNEETQQSTPVSAQVHERSTAVETQASDSKADANGGWQAWGAWGSSLLKHAQDVTDHITSDATVKQWQNLVNKETIEKLGKSWKVAMATTHHELGDNLRHFTDQIIETVAPPIAEHELVAVWLGHDISGLKGIEALVYRAFALVMDHTESGDVVVQKGGNRPESDKSDSRRELNMCEGIENAIKLAQANVDHLIKTHGAEPTVEEEPSDSDTVPVTTCPVFMALQPTKIVLDDLTNTNKLGQLVIVVLLVDPTHNLRFCTQSQSIPLTWLDVPEDDDLWVDDKLTDILRMAVTTVAQDYVWTRMSDNAPASDSNQEA